MVIVLVLVSVALAVTLGLLMFGPNRGGPPPAELQARIDSESAARLRAEAELEKKRKEWDEQRAAVNDLRDQLKQTKKKLHDQKEADKEGQDLHKARQEVERNASVQLEMARTELHDAQQESTRLRAELDMLRGRKGGHSAPAPAHTPAPAPAAHAPPPPPERVIRELSPQEKEKMERLEHQASKDRARAAELDRDLKRVKSKLETQHRVYVVTKGEADLLRDKFKALEKRLNRTLLEKDLLRRAIKDLEKKTGHAAERTELTADEIAASDRKVDERVAAEAAEAARAQEKLAAAEPAKPAEGAETAEAASGEAAAAPPEDQPAPNA
ncbi:MAG TPA: cell envelope biogenesis protein TolA [Myxococcales bacterium]|nr:cell envelope biogenesis protein TolA [Myxococcales bacterium]